MTCNEYSKWFLRSAVVVCTVSFQAACSDGQLSTRPAEALPAVVSPVLINSFTVADAKDPNAKADKTATIDAGGSVMVSWDVGNAKKLEITDSRGKRLSSVDGLVGATQSDPLMADETFTLTAEGSDGVKAQDTATVTIRKKEIKITSFRADPDKINAGESTQLCWVVTDPTAKVGVKAGDVEIYPGNAVPETTSVEQPSADVAVTSAKAMRLLLKGGDTPSAPPADSYAAATEPPKTDDKPADAQEVCPVTQNPTQTTTYTLSVMDGDTVAAKQDATVTVKSAPPEIAAFTAQPAQMSGPGEVSLTWRVTPGDVTVSIDHGVTSNDKAEGEKKVQVTETTTFTLTATTKDGQPQTKTVTVTLPSAAERRVEAKTLTPSIFAGETAKIAITHGNASGKVSVLDAFGRAPTFTVNAGVVSIPNATVGSNSYTLDIDGERSNPVTVEVRNVVMRSSTGTHGVTFSGSRNVVAGFDKGGVEEKKEGDVTKYELNVGVVTLLDMEILGEKKVDISPYLVARINPDFGKSGQLKFFEPYPIRAIAVDGKDPKRVFFGTTGALFVSSNGGGSWQLVDPLPIFDNARKNTSSEQHAGCGGSVQNGVAYDQTNGALVDFIQVCDIVADGKSVILATDQGTYHIGDVDARLDGAKRKDNPWLAGITGKVVNKLATAKSGDQTVIVAAASDGVYINAKQGDPKTWQQLDKDGLKDATAVHTVAVSGTTVYAGTSAGLYRYDGLDLNGKWTRVLTPAGKSHNDSLNITAVAVDAADPSVLYVGTTKNLKVSRDCAGSFADVAVDVGEVRNIATATEGGRSAVVLTSDKGLFSSVGAASAGSCAAPTPQQTEIGKPKPHGTPQPTTTGPGTAQPH